ncbi:heme ABC transporter ATP-binding protein [Chromatocurvus halotolerans]|uniref:Iron complex transport system ATP-binding protein n=1 Tax=Chromatocurvus halotolerans TaxID=1132028 RepID=A0A4R2L3B5_9GAMM|nr:heme ABC transporter ATP-binding protein [Chromatocurvus halotolerans]TCO78429.1 iron complex transport system ATP-binding protein [Chromatocurvus halotolerans]
MTTLALHDASAGWGACPVLTGISLRCKAGDIVGLLGPNGAGKSTLLRLIAGDTDLLAGSAELGSKPLASWSSAARARCIAYLPQASSLTFPFTVSEVVALGRLPHAGGRQCDMTLVEWALAATDTQPIANRLYPLLSGGEKQRVQLARVLCQLETDASGGSLDGKLLLLDEPTAALDLRHQQDLVALLRQLAGRGCTVLVALHDINLLSSLCHRVMVVDRGHGIALGTPAEVFSADFLQSLYGTPLCVSTHPTGGYPLVFPQ